MTVWQARPDLVSHVARRRLGRLPGSPILVVAPPGPSDPRLVSRRMRLWNNQLGCMGKVNFCMVQDCMVHC